MPYWLVWSGDAAGNLYGMTAGGAFSHGTVFAGPRVRPSCIASLGTDEQLSPGLDHRRRRKPMALRSTEAHMCGVFKLTLPGMSRLCARTAGCAPTRV